MPDNGALQPSQAVNNASPLSLRSADLIVPTKSPNVEDSVWAMPSINLPTDWSSRNFDVLGSQPSWTFAVGQGIEAVH